MISEKIYNEVKESAPEIIRESWNRVDDYLNKLKKIERDSIEQRFDIYSFVQKVDVLIEDCVNKFELFFLSYAILIRGKLFDVAYKDKRYLKINPDLISRMHGYKEVSEEISRMIFDDSYDNRKDKIMMQPFSLN